MTWLRRVALPDVFSAAVARVTATGYSVRATIAPSGPLYVTLAYAVRPVGGDAVDAWLRQVESCLPSQIRLSRIEERRTGDLGPFEYAALRR